MTYQSYFFVKIGAALLFNAAFLLNARPSYMQHMHHIYYFHCGGKEEALLNKPEPPEIIESAAPSANSSLASALLENHDDQRDYITTIKTTFTPLLAHYYFEKIIPQDPATTSLEEQLEYVHMVATFIARLGAKYDSLSEEVRLFMKTPFAQEQALVQLITKILVCLQNYFAERLAAYKNIKQPTNMIKELKKVTTATAKQLDILCQKILQLNPHEI